MTASIIGLAAGLFQTTRPGTSTLAICRHGVVLPPCPEKAKATALPQHLNPLPYPVGQLVNAASTFVSTPSFSLMTSALRIRPGLLTLPGPLNLRQRSFRFSPPRCYQASPAGTSSLLQRHRSVGPLPPHTRHALGFHLEACLPAKTGYGVRLPRLLHRLPVNDATLNHSTGLTEYWASRYFARLPT